jgi:peptide deformylase
MKRGARVEIVHYPDPILRQKAAPVAEITDEVVLRAREMVELMHEARGVGLAAPQVGWSVQLCVLNPTPEQRGNELVCINPVIAESDGEQVSEEGCLSFPDLKGNVVRAARLTCRFYDLSGERREVAANGLLARIFQHEIDHLNGRLIVDLMTPASRLAVRGRLKELEREFKARRLRPSLV